MNWFKYDPSDPQLHLWRWALVIIIAASVLTLEIVL